MLYQPIGYDLCHPCEIFALRELMVGAGQQLKVFLGSEPLKELPALVQRDMLIAVTLHDDGRRSDGSRGIIGNLTESIFIKGIAKRYLLRATHDVRNRVGGLPLCHSVYPKFEP